MRYLFAIAAFVTFSCTSNIDPLMTGDLEVGVSKSGSLDKKQTVSYKLDITEGTFLAGHVMQKSVDVVVDLKDSEGEVIDSFDGPAAGPENFTFLIEKSGSYTLEVSPFEEESGDYEVLLMKAEPAAKDPEGRVDQMVWAFSGDNPGAVIGVLKDGQMVFTKAYGKANLSHDLDFGATMPTNIGSVSKQFTAMAILLLEKEGKLSLDDDVRKHIPELPDLGAVVRVRNILNHTNGWREVYNLMPITGWKGEDRLLKEEVLRILQKQKELQAAPGEEFNYNNSAYIMAAEIVERLSGKDFPTYVDENIFTPLGMENSYVRKDPRTIIPGATQGYSNGDDGYIESRDLDASYGAGGIYTTPEDLSKWMNNFETAQVGGEEVIQKLVTPWVLNNGDTMSYALGIGVGEYRGQKRYSHGGADIAHRAMLIYYPDVRSGVVTLSNNASFPSSIANRIADVFLEDYFEVEVEEFTEETESGEFSVSAEELASIEGKYIAESIGLVIEFKSEEGELVAYPVGQSSLKMKPTAQDAFDYEGVEASIVFKKDENGEYTTAVHTQGGSDLEFVKAPPFDPTPDDLMAYTGRYYSDELETFYELTVKDTILVAQHRNVEDIELTPTKEDSFSGDVFFMSTVEFLRSNDEVNGFTLSNGRTKGILFERLR